MPHFHASGIYHWSNCSALYLLSGTYDDWIVYLRSNYLLHADSCSLLLQLGINCCLLVDSLRFTTTTSGGTRTTGNSADWPSRRCCRGRSSCSRCTSRRGSTLRSRHTRCPPQSSSTYRSSSRCTSTASRRRRRGCSCFLFLFRFSCCRVATFLEFPLSSLSGLLLGCCFVFYFGDVVRGALPLGIEEESLVVLCLC
jgi:hypothetical protein